ncbi:MAG: NAD(+) synthase, partial [Syntrophobacterales bacterium]|nr:NAD(+) synthase [Syntrophobacterales bacterium]
GIAVKSLPSARHEYHYEPGEGLPVATINFGEQKDIPVGTDLLFKIDNLPAAHFYVSMGEDFSVPAPLSSFAALAGATMLLHLSSSPAAIGEEKRRHDLAAAHSIRCCAACLRSASGGGESSTDLAWDGQAMIYEMGDCLASAKRFAMAPRLIFADIDLDRLAQERMRNISFARNGRQHGEYLRRFRPISFSVALPFHDELLLQRELPRFPCVPSDADVRRQWCLEAFQIQTQGLAKRLVSSGIQKVVLGVSGGLDSTLALIAVVFTMDHLGYPRTNIKAYTMPAFGTTERTLNNARQLMKELGVDAHEKNIETLCLQMLRDINHPFANGQSIYDRTFENVQAGERTSLLFRLANQEDALVVGTGDLSELALGWCTYGVGDHMSHYNINASIPKTLVSHPLLWSAEDERISAEAKRIICDILQMDISPELIPGQDGEQSVQKTEDVIGPYELQDFHLFYTLRFGYLPTKIAFLAYCAWHDVHKGTWPGTPDHKKHAYSLSEIKKWLRIFLCRFFQTTQYKRTCVPNGPSIDPAASLSPRGSYCVPSDSEAAIWLANLNEVPDDL